MGLLQQQSSDRQHELTSEFSVGRDPGCSLTLDDPMVSSQHATVRWNGNRWTVRDLASLNGTFVDGKAIPAGRTLALKPGARLAFGNEHEVFVLVDSSPPAARAVADNGEALASDHGMLILPDAKDPEVTIFLAETGAWLAEYNDGTRVPVRTGTEIHTGARTWQLSVPTVLAPTVRGDDVLFNLHSSTVRFRVALDEESVSVELFHRGQKRVVEAKSHLYLILTLARARLADREHVDLPASEHGWRDIDELMDQLKVDESHINVWIYRARKQFATADIQGATELVERRKGERKIRIGATDIEITR